jgi:hypothetical protein
VAGTSRRTIEDLQAPFASLPNPAGRYADFASIELEEFGAG